MSILTFIIGSLIVFALISRFYCRENKVCLDDSSSLMGSFSKAISATSDYIPSVVTDVINYSPPWMGSISDVVSASTSYLPTMVTDVFTQSRDIFCVYLPHAGMKSVCAMVS